jgi:hypothetical protein
MCRLLIERGADPAHTDSHGKTALEYARKAKFLETAEFLNGEVRRAKEGRGVQPEGKEGKEGKEGRDGKEGKQTYRLVFLGEKGDPHELSEEDAAQLLEGNPYLRQLLENPDSISEQQLATTEVESW